MQKHVAPTYTPLDFVFKYLVAAILIFIPLYPKFPLFILPFTYVAIRVEDFLIFSTFLVFVLNLLINSRPKFPKITFQFVVFWTVALVSVASAIFVTKNINPLLAILHLFRRFEYMIVFFLVYFASKDSGSRRYFFELLLFPSLGVLLYGIAQIYFGAPVISTMDSESSKGIALTLRPGVTLNSTFAGHYDLAIYLVMIMSFICSLGLQSKKNLQKTLYFLSFGALLWLFSKAGSRIGLLGLVVSISLIGYFHKKVVMTFLYLLLVTTSILMTPQYLSRFKSIWQVIKTTTSQTVTLQVYAQETPTVTQKRAIEQDTSTSIRFDVEWPRAMRSFYKNPFLGTGYSSISLATDNDYLRALGETGILGLLSLLALLLGLVKKILILISENSEMSKVYLVGALGVFASFVLSAIFIDVFESSKIAILFWAIMGLAFSYNKKYV